MLTVCVSILSFQSPILKSNLPGNIKFDPLQLSTRDVFVLNEKKRTDTEILHDYREAELKHGRLAMLASVAYPAQEILNPILSKNLGLPLTLAANNLSPSLVNGNLDSSTLIYFLGLASGLEIFKMNQKNKIPGDYGWRVKKYSDNELYKLQNGEIWNGRLAMLAVLGYVVQEAVTKMPVISI